MAEPGPAGGSAVLVPVPEAERVVSPHRSRLDGAAALGVPAHVTVLYPFVPPPAITPSVVDALAVAVASVSAFGCEFGATAWLPGYRHYGGAHADPVPHLTVGDRPAGGDAELRAAEAAVRPQLPVRAQVRRVWLMTGRPSPGSWRTLAELPLATG
jgi:hypothetical protein